MKDDATLLQSYVTEGSQAAFAELVHRHLGLVYQAALRQTAGDPHRAEEVAQLVFTALARKAATLSRHPLLVAWLHTSTHYAASQLRRTEQRRRAREQEAFAMNEAGPDPRAAADWERLRPILDDALQSIGERDRAAVLLRFFENRSYAELGAALSLSEEAARARVNRSLEKLRSALARRGLPSTASALTLALAQPAFASAPAGLAAQIAASSLAAASAGAATGLGIVSFAGAVKIVAGVVGALALLSVGIALRPSSPVPEKIVIRPAAAPSATAGAALPSNAFPPPPSPPAIPRVASGAAPLRPPPLLPDEVRQALEAYLALAPLPPDAAAVLVNPRAAELRGLLSLLPTDLFERLLNALAARSGKAENHLRGIAFEVWTERDAPAAARWSAGLVPNDALDAPTRGGYLRQAALAWSAQDFDAAYAWADALSEPALVGDLANALLVSLAGTDGPRALTLARARGNEFFAKTESRLVLGWAGTEPAAVVQTLGATALAEGRFDYAYQKALSGWFRKKPAAALDWLFAQPPPDTSLAKFTFESLITNGEVLSLPDPGLVANALLGRPEQAQYLPPLVKNWATRAPEAALAWLDTLSDATLRAELIEYASSQAAMQPGTGRYLPFILRLPPGDDRDAKITQILSSWAKASPDAAFAWLHAHDTPEFAGVNTRMNGKLIGDLAATDPVTALAHWKELPAGPAKTATAGILAQNWAKIDPAGATRWYAETLPTIPADQSTLIPLMSMMLRLRPGSTAQIRSDGAEELSVAYHTFAATIATWAQKEPLPALRWAETLADTSQRQLAFTALSTAGSAPFLAQADLLAQIQDPALRAGAVSEALDHWVQKDPAAVRAWLDSNDVLTPEQAAQILRNAKPSRP